MCIAFKWNREVECNLERKVDIVWKLEWILWEIDNKDKWEGKRSQWIAISTQWLKYVVTKVLLVDFDACATLSRIRWNEGYLEWKR